MTKQQRKAMELALEALDDKVINEYKVVKAITAIKEALAQQSNEQVEPVAYQNIDLLNQVVSLEDWEDIESMWHTMYRPLFAYPPVPTAQPKEPEQEPVAEYIGNNPDEPDLSKRIGLIERFKFIPLRSKLYTTSPQRTWVGLTTDDWDEIKKQVNYNFEMTTGEYAERISHLVEDRLQEKNT